MLFRRLPWEYAVRNLFRRPLRTGLTLVGLTTVILLVFIVVGFIRGLTGSLIVSGDARTAIVFAEGMGTNLEYSSIDMKVADQVPSSVSGIESSYGKKAVSPELYLGTEIQLPDHEEKTFGLVRGVTDAVLTVRKRVELEQGTWPQLGEVMVGELAAAKLGATTAELAIGNEISMEGRSWKISGVFSSGGSAFESEIWCRLDELQQAMKRQDLSLLALSLSSASSQRFLQQFCQDRKDLALRAMPEKAYYDTLQEGYAPFLQLAWLVVALIAGAGIFAGLNTMYGSIVGRVRELATLQTIGFGRGAILISLLQEGVLLSAAASLAATALAITFVNGASVRFTMGAFNLRIDAAAILIGCGVGISLGIIGALPPAARALRMPVVLGLKSV